MKRIVLFLTLSIFLASCASDDTVQPTTGSTQSGDAKNGNDATLGEGLSDGGVSADVPDWEGFIADIPAATADASTSDVVAKYGVCSNLFLCTQVACGQSIPKGCAQVCIDAASPEAQAQYLPFGQCVEQYCRQGLCAGSSDPACMGNCAWQKCYGKLLPCGSDGKSGSASCDAMIGCYEQCQGKDPKCIFDCYATLSSAAQSDYQAMNDCFVAAGGTDPGKTCPDQLFKCLSGGKSGPKTCLDTLNCSDGCNSLAEAKKFACIAECYGQSTVDAQKTYLGVAKCMGGTATGTCTQDIVACTNPSGTKNCLEAITCIDPCKASGKSEGMCIFSCMNQSTKVEAAKFIELLICVGNQCQSCNGEKSCEDACTKAKCKAQTDACLGA